MGLMLFAKFFFFHPQAVKDVQWIVFKSDKPLQKNEKNLKHTVQK